MYTHTQNQAVDTYRRIQEETQDLKKVNGGKYET